MQTFINRNEKQKIKVKMKEREICKKRKKERDLEFTCELKCVVLQLGAKKQREKTFFLFLFFSIWWWKQCQLLYFIIINLLFLNIILILLFYNIFICVRHGNDSYIRWNFPCHTIFINYKALKLVIFVYWYYCENKN